ncbi:CoA transferase [Streptomyces sp. H10-C2]|uniref:CaiB/BaiF CoA transferase family protein n=1 Tax=unclassified Streptomyces TaxID=2593676 RepID=UPI0024BA82F4|nr:MULTISPECIES: CoA transferase [unclassified Streptomyces]MDJ0341435.1 CoA transferase [Streptomyces sp. PH10-H1]MDJ0369092.1 CoA transferase [Streptomyces sp. H10-C2]
MSEPTAAPLDGVLVADFSRVLAGPLATATLADLGATVVKVERPGGDDTRAWGPPFVDGTATYFDAVNRSKHGITLDLADPDDAEAARELARRADILVENFRPGGLTRYGLDHTSVRAANPGLVYCSISGFGSGSDLPGYDFVVQAVGGLMSITGDTSGEPHKVGVALVDVLTAKDAVTAVLAALRHRDRTGEGQLVEVNLLSSLLGSLANQASGYLATGRAPRAMGNQHPSIAPYETLHCGPGRSGLLAVACGNDGQFRVLAKALDAPGLAEDPRFATNPGRVQNRLALIAALETALAAHDAAHWQRLLTVAGVPCGPVNDLAGAFALAADLGLDPIAEVGAGRVPQVRSPLRLSATPVRPPVAPPRLGEHDAALRAWLAAPADTPPPALPCAEESPGKS